MKYTPEYCESLLAASPGACTTFYGKILRWKEKSDMEDHETHILNALKEGPANHFAIAARCRTNGDIGMDAQLAKRILDRLARDRRIDAVLGVYSANTGEAAVAVAPTPAEQGNAVTAEDRSKWDTEPPPGKYSSHIDYQKADPIRAHDPVPLDPIESCAALNPGQSFTVVTPEGKRPNVYAQELRNRLLGNRTRPWMWSVNLGPDRTVIVTKRGLRGAKGEAPVNGVEFSDKTATQNPKMAPLEPKDPPLPKERLAAAHVVIADLDRQIGILQDLRANLVELYQVGAM